MKYIGIILVVLGVGCAGWQPGPTTCETEERLVGVFDAGIHAAGTVLEGEADDELAIAHGITNLGRAAVAGCILLRDGAGWQQWVGLAMEVAVGLHGLISGSSNEHVDEVPPELAEAIDALEDAD